MKNNKKPKNKKVNISLFSGIVFLIVLVGVVMGSLSVFERTLELTTEKFLEIMKETNPNYTLLDFEYQGFYDGKVLNGEDESFKHYYSLHEEEHIEYDNNINHEYYYSKDLTNEFKRSEQNEVISAIYNEVENLKIYKPRSDKIPIEKTENYVLENAVLNQSQDYFLNNAKKTIEQQKDFLFNDAAYPEKHRFFNLTYLTYITYENNDASYLRLIDANEQVGYRAVYKYYTGLKNQYCLNYKIDFDMQGCITSLYCTGTAQYINKDLEVFIFDNISVSVKVNYDTVFYKYSALPK